MATKNEQIASEILKELVYNDNLEVAVTAALNSFMPVEELLKIITGTNVEEDVRNEAYDITIYGTL